MTNYHVNPNTMEPGRCDAQNPDSCKFRKGDGEPVPHFASEADAQEHVESVLTAAFGAVSQGQRKPVRRGGPAPRVSVMGAEYYGGSANRLPHVDGTRIVMDGDETHVYTVRLKPMMIGGNRITYHTYLEDEEGEPLWNSPGRDYRVYDGPDTAEFRTELRRLHALAAMEDSSTAYRRSVHPCTPDSPRPWGEGSPGTAVSPGRRHPGTPPGEPGV